MFTFGCGRVRRSVPVPRPVRAGEPGSPNDSRLTGVPPGRYSTPASARRFKAPTTESDFVVYQKGGKESRMNFP